MGVYKLVGGLAWAGNSFEGAVNHRSRGLERYFACPCAGGAQG